MASVAPSVLHTRRRLAGLAELSVTRGVNLQRGQELIISAPLEAAELARVIARRSYAHGAKAVTCIYEDPMLVRTHLTEADPRGLDYAPAWLSHGIAEGMRSGAAWLHLVGPYPDLLSDVPFDRVTRAHHSRAQAMGEQESWLAAARTNWCVLPVATASWAKQVFPAVPDTSAQRRLRTVLFDVMRLADSDPLQAWDRHMQVLDSRRDALQRCSFRSLRFFDHRSELTVDLRERHRWVGGRVTAANGVRGVHSIPAEELFTELDGRGTHGKVFFSRPIALGGTAVENLYVEFEHGGITAVHADRGLEAFEHFIKSEERSGRLGEVGLAPASSPVARAGIDFWNPLLDRNAASHVAFGGRSTSRPHQADGGGGDEAIQIDCMLGHAALNVDGVTQSGDAVPVMRGGEFVDLA